MVYARSLSVDKPRVVLPALMTVLFLDWLLKQCIADGTKPDNVITSEARGFLAEKLNTPLQIAEHLNRAFTDTFRMCGDQVSADIVQETNSAGFDDLDTRLARIGYSPKTLAEQFDLTQAEAWRFLKSKLDTDRTTELGDILRQARPPIRGCDLIRTQCGHVRR